VWCYRLATLYYSDEGMDISEQIWNETMDELEFAGVKEIVASL
jgi:hypothetical protein